MWKPRWLLALPLALASTLSAARASTVLDQANLFSADAVQQAKTELNRIERETQLTTTIETTPSIGEETIVQATRQHAERSGTKGLYILIAKKEGKIDALASSAYRRSLDGSRLSTIQDAFIRQLKKRDFDAALLDGVKAIGSEASASQAALGSLRQGAAAAPARRVGPGGGGRPVRPQAGGFGLGSLLGIGLLIVGVLFFVRLLGSLFRGGQQGYGAPGRMGGAPGYGPGYGGGGGGGGFMSSLFGGIGGAMAGNWLYDQFSGRHQGGYTDSSTAGDPGAGTSDDWGGGTNVSGDWGGGDAGGGGGDWGGGGGGDWGGGGGDGGGGGGGDW
ncbi:MAG: hypothetical protein NVSMB9_20930 [Isosphaeraceae bacterium]